MFAPIEDEQEADEHAAKVGEVGDAVVAAEDALEEFDGYHADDEPFGLDGHQEVEVDVFVGEQHSEGQQKGIDGSRGTHRDMNARHEHIKQSCSDAANKVVEQEAPCAPIVLQGVAEHPQGEHIEEEMVK